MTSDLLIAQYQNTRAQSLKAFANLEPEDVGLQGAVFASPPKWHLAHTTWFFETFILKPFAKDYRAFNPRFEVLFNSYYNGIGIQHPRAERGMLSRPALSEILAYREYVDRYMLALLDSPSHAEQASIQFRCRLGLQHEQQHQELFYTDIKYSFSRNPLFPALLDQALPSALQKERYSERTMTYSNFDGAEFTVGLKDEEEVFGFDNERPAHTVSTAPFQFANRLVNNAEYQAFVEDGGYRRAELWLADGWAWVQNEAIDQPLYWYSVDGRDMEFTLYGLHERLPHAPVTHVNAYEADAYATWAGARLPTEFEWERVARLEQATDTRPSGFVAHPGGQDSSEPSTPAQLFGHCWQWTGSAYRPYPGYRKAEGAIGEYNGKFMCNQWVLRGSSCVTTEGHSRATYRNFFYPEDRWQFSGIRLAKDV